MKKVVTEVIGAVRDVMFGDDDTAVGIIDEACESFEDLWAWHLSQTSVSQARYALKEAIERAMLRDLKGQAIRMDDALIRPLPPEALVKLRDPEGLRDYLGLSLGAQLAFDPGAIKIDGVRAFAKEQGDNPDVIVEKFFEFKEGDGPGRIKVTKLEYAPRWALTLKHGQRIDQPERKSN